MINPNEQMAALNQLIAVNKANIEAAFNFANASLEGAERLLNLQLGTAKDALAESASALMKAKDPKDLSALQATFETNVEKTLTYSRSVYDVATQTRGELTKIVEGRVAEFNKNLVTALENALKSAPAGSEPAVNAIRSAISAANSAYDSMAKAAKQATDVAEANIASAVASAKKKPAR